MFGRFIRVATDAAEIVELDRIWFTWETTRSGVPPSKGRTSTSHADRRFPR
jgi:hypothetical protein